MFEISAAYFFSLTLHLFFVQKILLEITINTLSECSQMGSLIMNEENEEAKENGEWVEERGRTRKNEIFSLIDNLMNTLLQNLSAQEVSCCINFRSY